ncbi:hypothetical protein ABT354_11845 [Streptomyces sp. NPDC000594]|uniref:hypothetical protein n=1 Tax=Streptomyces sp. NPDC000594 TaxID=3154261 RepID=UPI003323A1F9
MGDTMNNTEQLHDPTIRPLDNHTPIRPPVGGPGSGGGRQGKPRTGGLGKDDNHTPAPPPVKDPDPAGHPLESPVSTTAATAGTSALTPATAGTGTAAAAGGETILTTDNHTPAPPRVVRESVAGRLDNHTPSPPRP